MALDVMEYFLRDLNRLNYGSRIASEKKMNQKTVSNILNSLEKEGFLKSSMAGKTKQFRFKFSDLSREYINIVENSKTVGFYKKNPKIRDLICKIKPFLNGIVVIFGSYAKGLQKKDSDLDIFVAGSYDADNIRKISKLYNITINIKSYKENEFIMSLKEKGILVNEIIKDHILVSKKEGFVDLMLRYYYGYS